MFVRRPIFKKSEKAFLVSFYDCYFSYFILFVFAKKRKKVWVACSIWKRCLEKKREGT